MGIKPAVRRFQIQTRVPKEHCSSRLSLTDCKQANQLYAGFNEKIFESLHNIANSTVGGRGEALHSKVFNGTLDLAFARLACTIPKLLWRQNFAALSSTKTNL